MVLMRTPGIDNQFRLTIDYYSVHTQTVPVTDRTPTQGEVIDSVRCAKFYARFDLPESFGSSRSTRTAKIFSHFRHRIKFSRRCMCLNVQQTGPALPISNADFTCADDPSQHHDLLD